MEQRWERMHKKIHSVMILTLLLMGMLTLAFNIQPVRAIGTIYIRADGSIDPPTAPIIRDGDLYTLTDDILSDTEGIVIERNNMTLDGADHALQGSGAWYSRGVSLIGRSNVTIKNLIIKDFTAGIDVEMASNNSFYENNVIDNWYGITLEHSSNNNSICGNNVTNNEYWGINLYESSRNNNILRNNVTDNLEDGISLDMSSSNNSICGNNVASNRYGIRLWYSPNNSISENNIKENGYGIMLGESSSNTISGNNITNNIYGISLSESSNNRISGNNITAIIQYGIELQFSSNNNSITENAITNNYNGILLGHSSNYNSVSGNTMANNLDGIRLSSSSNNSISGNNITANNWAGIRLSSSSNNNSISGNNIMANNNEGIFLGYSSNNRIKENNIVNNDEGIFPAYSSNNRIYHNNLINNTDQARLYESFNNTWDDGYPSGGNYWSDYEETYPDAEELDDSGIWDTPYYIDDYNQDNYPLMKPWTLLPATIDELKTEIEELGSEGEIDNQGIVTSLLAKLNAAQRLVDSGKIDQAENMLNAFINEVQAQSGKHVTPEAADILIESAEYILSHL